MKGIYEGIRILDFTNTIAGPECSAVFGDQGAEIIHIEKPEGDDGRYYYPQVECTTGGSVGSCHLRGNRGKKSLCIALKDPEALKVIKELLVTTDVIIENNRPGVMKKLGIDYETVRQIKPDIVYCSISMFGQTGPLSSKPGYDPIAQAMSGLMDLTGDPDGGPTRIGTTIGDYSGAYTAALGIASALFHRFRTGEGNYIDVAITDCLITANAYLEAAALGLPATRAGKHELTAAPYGIFDGNGGSCFIVAPSNSLWAKLCELMGKPELITDTKFATPIKRANEGRADLINVIEVYVKSFATIDEAVKVIDEAGLPVTKILTSAEVANHPHFLQRGSITDIPLPKNHKAKSFRGKGIQIIYSNTPGHISGPAPLLGEHNTEILRALGKSDSEITALNDKWMLDESKRVLEETGTAAGKRSSHANGR
jgi:CoA:oxalate CoA-transferase